jgi:hypothetical protein
MAQTVIRWYRDANMGAHWQGPHGLPTEAAVLPIVRLIDALKDYHQRPGDAVCDAQGGKELATVRTVQRALHELLGELPKLRDIYLREAAPGSAEVQAMDALLTQTRATAASLSLDHPPPPAGRRSGLWLVWADALLEPILAAWRVAGRRGPLSLKADRPVIKILCPALEAIDGQTRDPEAVASALRRQAAARAKRVPELTGNSDTS